MRQRGVRGRPSETQEEARIFSHLTQWIKDSLSAKPDLVSVEQWTNNPRPLNVSVLNLHSGHILHFAPLRL